MELIVGKKYILDKGYRNSGEVILVRTGRLFCTVKETDSGYEWETMINRLSDLPTVQECDARDGE